jgi:hypothetical protein
MRCEDKEKAVVSNTDQIEGQQSIEDYQQESEA